MTTECLEIDKNLPCCPQLLFLFFASPLAKTSISNLAAATAPVKGTCHLTEGCFPLMRAPELFQPCWPEILVLLPKLRTGPIWHRNEPSSKRHTCLQLAGVILSVLLVSSTL